MPKSANDQITAAIKIEEHVDTAPRVSVLLPLPPESETGLKYDPYEHVTINGETTYIMRGERVDVTVPVFMVLKAKYPNL